MQGCNLHIYICISIYKSNLYDILWIFGGGGRGYNTYIYIYVYIYIYGIDGLKSQCSKFRILYASW